MPTVYLELFPVPRDAINRRSLGLCFVLCCGGGCIPPTFLRFPPSPKRGNEKKPSARRKCTDSYVEPSCAASPSSSSSSLKKVHDLLSRPTTTVRGCPCRGSVEAFVQTLASLVSSHAVVSHQVEKHSNTSRAVFPHCVRGTESSEPTFQQSGETSPSVGPHTSGSSWKRTELN